MIFDMNKSTILVTGASGFTGKNLARKLATQGHSVRTLLRRPEAGQDLSELGIEVVKGDLRDPDSLLRACENVELVFHIAAAYRTQGIDRKLFSDVNVEGTRHMFDAAIKRGAKRFVHCSTIGVHGDIETPPANETAPYAPGDLYQESKLAGEMIALEHMNKGDLEVTIFRPAGIYGPGDMRFLKLFKGIKRRRFPMLGNGQVYYHFTYIDDLVDGILLCGSEQAAIGQTYILAGEEYVPLNEVVSLIAHEVGAPPPRLRFPIWPVYLAGFACELLCRPFSIEPPLYRRRVDFFRKSRAFDISKAKRELGYQPKVSLKDGIHKTAEWYRKENLL